MAGGFGAGLEAEAGLEAALEPQPSLLWGEGRARRAELQRQEETVLAVMDDVLYGLVCAPPRRCAQPPARPVLSGAVVARCPLSR